MRTYRNLMCIGLLALCISCRSVITKAAPGSDSSGPLETLSLFLSAFNHLDVVALGRLFSEDATAYLPFATTGARLNGREAILAAIQPMFAAERSRFSHGAPYLSLVANDVNVQRVTNDLAVISFDAGNQHVFSRRTIVVRMVNRRWEIIHLHASNVRSSAD